MRNNENLAAQAKKGNRDAMAELWEQNRGLIYRLVSRYFPLCNAVVSQEDLIQAAYFGLVCAVKAYDPNREYVLASYLSYSVRNAVRDAFGHRGRKDYAPLVVSLDAPVKGFGDEGITLADTLEDETATAEFEQLQTEWERGQLRACLDDCMCELAPEQAATICARYYEGKALQAIADETDSEKKTVRLLEQKALRALRRPKHSHKLRAFLSYSTYSGYGLQAYKDRGFVSKVEVLAGVYY